MTGFTDIPQNGLKRFLPQWLTACIELARLDRPIGSWLLLFPCFWGVALAGGGEPRLYLLFAVGAFVMRGAGCTFNDIIDRRLDAGVGRTQGRPLPSGRIGVPGAILFLIVQLAFGLAVLLQLNRPAIELGCASLLLAASYPFMKRITWWPQLVLGLAFNLGALMGWVAVTGHLALAPTLLYLGGIAWTLGYDTIYAHQDKSDDAVIGIKSTALRFGSMAKPPVATSYALALALMTAAGWQLGLGWAFYVVLAITAFYVLWLLQSWDSDLPASCLAKFRANRLVGLAIFAAIVLGRHCV